MADEQDRIEAALSIQTAARIADQILQKAEDGTKLFTVHRHYPTRWQAVEFGFYFAIGLVFAFCFCVMIGKAVSLIVGLFT